VRQPDFIDCINEPVRKALQPAPPSLAVAIRIHVTRKDAAVERGMVNGPEAFEPPGGHSSSASAESTRGNVLAFESVKVESGRPDLTKMLGEEVQSATGRLSVSGELSTSVLSVCVLICMLSCSVWFAGDGADSETSPSVPGIESQQCVTWWTKCIAICRNLWLRLDPPTEDLRLCCTIRHPS